METTDYKNYKIRISQDTNASNPIEDWDGNAKYALFHKRLGVQNDTDLHTKDYSGWVEFKKALVKKYKALAILPVYMYDHSGQTISTEPFSCKWDSGQLGFVFINKEVLKEWGFKSRKGYEKATDRTLEDDLRRNVALYDDYITGNVFGFEVLDSEDEVLDSCWGYYGDGGREDATNEAKSIIDALVNEQNKMLTNENIAEKLLSDMGAYRENIKEIIVGRLMDSSHQRTYWDAWFRGATGKDLENADAGKIFQTK